MKSLISLSSLLLLGYWLVLAEPAYQSRGWRPQGPVFNPVKPPLPPPQHLPSRYGPPLPPSPSPPVLEISTGKTTTTPRSKESTTTQKPDEEFETNPALAIANSFAFNRPIYVYNSFPYLNPVAAYTLLSGGQLTF